MRIVIVGAGIMGCATALELARKARCEVLLLERAVPGAEASSAAAGMLAAQIESKSAEERAMFVRARDGYAGWAAELRERTGIDIGHRKSGVLELATSETALEKLRVQVIDHQRASLRAEIVEEPFAVEPEISRDVLGGAYFPDEAQVDPPQLLRALSAAIAFSAPAISVRSNVTVASLVEAQGRCTGVTLADRETIHADAVVLAAGSWSSLVPGAGAALPAVRPVRGQLVMLEERPPRLRTIAFLNESYVVPRGDGRVVCGSTMEDVGHRREVTAGGIASILTGATRIAPSLASAAYSHAWCNFRPWCEEGPQIGRSKLPGLFLATGHHRNGILLAKTTAETVADAIFL